jgi:hypothetical protein
VAVPEAGVTVVVNVTVLPAVCGLALDVTAVVVEVSAALIVSVSVELVLAANAVVPPYAAVIVCVPAVRLDVE